MKFLSLVQLFLLCTTSLSAQSGEHHTSPRENEKGTYEIIMSGIYVFEQGDDFAGTEFHFTYWINDRWGGGLSYTRKFEEGESRNGVALLGSWNPSGWMTLNAGPNLTYSPKNQTNEWGLYAESELNIRLKRWFHFGPVLGTVIGKSYEVSTGFHLGFEFQ
ncbi:MAG: hypothetical protein R8G66_32160 [Cytophagales bacterium]|nr:hypothetical protein [Cytophagales bacterium]